MTIEMRLMKGYSAVNQCSVPANALSLYGGGFAVLEYRELEEGPFVMQPGWVQAPVVEPVAVPTSAEDSELEEPRNIPFTPIRFRSISMVDHSQEKVRLIRTNEPRGILIDKSVIGAALLKLMGTADATP